MNTLPDELNIENEFYFQWHITERCNFSCSHCYQDPHKHSEELPLSDLIETAKKIQHALATWQREGHIAITGGEPFLHPHMFDILEYLEGIDEVTRLSVLTNASLIDKTTIQRLLAISKLNFVQVSLEGATPETNDGIRRKGAFNLTIKAIRNLQEAGIPVRVMATIQRDNAHEAVDILRLCQREGVSKLSFERMVPTGAGAKCGNDRILSPAELSHLMQELLDNENSNSSLLLKARTLWALLDPEGKSLNGENNPIGAMCSAGTDGLCIMPDGNVLPCRRLPIVIGNLKTDSIFEIWYKSPVLWELRKRTEFKGKCGSCELIPRCSGCRAIAYAVTGDYLAEDPQCWKINEN